MLQVRALIDGEQENKACLGTLRPLANDDAQPLSLKKKIQVRNIGSYQKMLVTPMYKKSAMLEATVEESGWKFDSANCLGVVCKGLHGRIDGYVRRICGVHTFCLPVYDRGAVPPAFYKIVGYLPVEEGFVAVARRRVLLWSLLGLCGGILFVILHMALRHGAYGAWDELCRFFGGLL